MAILESGHYTPRNIKRVHVWPTPDKDGDADPVWTETKDDSGNVIGRNQHKDAAGNVMRHYNPPDGFQNRPSFDHTDNYVAVDDRGRVRRTPSGDAINIRPGQAVVEHPDGSVEYLDDEYSMLQFRQSHDTAQAPSEESQAVPATDTVHEDVIPEEERSDWEAYQAWKADQKGKGENE
jgi:hypothetical protein